MDPKFDISRIQIFSRYNERIETTCYGEYANYQLELGWIQNLTSLESKFFHGILMKGFELAEIH